MPTGCRRSSLSGTGKRRSSRPVSGRRATSRPASRARDPRRLAAAMRPPPVDLPQLARHWNPAEPLQRCAARVVVECCGAFIEAARVGRGAPPEPLRVQVVTKLVAQGAEERAEGGHVLADGRPHPDPDPHGGGRVVPEELKSPPAL